MAIDPLSASPVSVTASSSNTSLSQVGEDYRSFLQLLTAQISNQDPLEPMDSSTFITQLAQLSQVEQAVLTNSNLEGLSSQMASVSAIAGSGLVGRTVVTESPSVALTEEGAAVSYVLDREATSVTVEFYGADGTLLRELPAAGLSADSVQTVAWDGLDSEGLPVPPGIYRVAVRATGAGGETLSASTYARAQVLQMGFTGDGLATLSLSNGDTILAAEVEAIE